jgi:hypothetical protein
MSSYLRYSFFLIVFSSLLILGCKKEEEEEEPPPTEFLTNELCEDSCYFKNDGDCDDGGPGSSSDYCKYGTDCTDCGTRVVLTPKR